MQQVESGKFRFKAVDFMHYKFHEILAKFKRVMDREIIIDGVKLQIKSPADAVKIYQIGWNVSTPRRRRRTCSDSIGTRK